jgi:hypothetical protein
MQPVPFSQGAPADRWMLSGHAAASLTFHSVSSTSAPLAPACGTPAFKARLQTSARLRAWPCGIKAVLVCAQRTAMRNTDMRNGKISH